MDAVVTRTIHLDAPSEEAWRSLSTADGLAGWLGDGVDLVVAVGAAGRVVDGDVVRRVVVTEVEAGRSLGFTWWSEDRPEDASTVRIDVVGEGQGCAVTVVERLGAAVPAQLADASVRDLDAGHRWDARLAHLVGEVAGARVPALA